VRSSQVSRVGRIWGVVADVHVVGGVIDVQTHTVPAELGAYLVQHQALFDRFTGLPGPALLLDRLEMALAHAQRVRCEVGVFFFADVHALGDHSPQLQALARQFCAEVRPDDTVARVCDRSFVVVCGDLDGDDAAASISQRLIEHASVLCRVGVALGASPEPALDLLARAAREASVAWRRPRA
jgi:GGDEF domain-containing protein